MQSYMSWVVPLLVVQGAAAIGWLIRNTVQMALLNKSKDEQEKALERFQEDTRRKFDDHHQWQQRQDTTIGDLGRTLVRVDTNVERILHKIEDRSN